MPLTLLSYTIESPLGRLTIRGTEDGVRGIVFEEEALTEGPVVGNEFRPLLACEEQLQKYFAGNLKTFHDLPLLSVGTDFQQRVWDAASGIGFGETVTYGELAEAVGDRSAARAVGTALGQNPICIIVPCHRIVSADGKGGGYAWGQWRKDWLLDHESK